VFSGVTDEREIIAGTMPIEYGSFLSSFWFVTERKKSDVRGKNNNPTAGE
jgi:hypothetical protein